MKAKENRPVLGIDIGGTKIIMALTSNPPAMMARSRVPTEASSGPDAVIQHLFTSIDKFLKDNNCTAAQLGGIGIACAGAIDTAKGIITLSPHLIGWHDVPLRDIVQAKYKVDTLLINDASAAALAEHRFGAGKGIRNMIYLTVSTGIGGGIIIENKLYEGVSGTAGEVGHMTLDVNGIKDVCGNTGCLETLASGTAIAREARARLKQGEKSALSKLKPEDITTEKIAEAAEQGDKLSQEVILEAATYLGVGLVGLVNIFNPEMIVIGGGVSNLGERLLAPARQVVNERAFALPASAVKIVRAGLKSDAEVLGAAARALEQKKD